MPPPLAGRPPFATYEPDSLFEPPPQSRRRVRKPADPDPNSRTSAYNVYDAYFDSDSDRQSGLGAVGFGLMNGSLDDDDGLYPAQKERHAPTRSPSPTAPPEVQPPMMGQIPQALRVTRPQADFDALRMPPPIYQTADPRPSVPSQPHPLQPPMTPIQTCISPVDVTFSSDPIIRSNSEDNLLPKRGERGDHFWRRFSMVAREEKKPSSWLTKTQNGTSRLSRWVWIVGITLLICIGAGTGIGWYISHKSPSHQQPTAVGGSANETTGPNSPTATAAGSSSPHVTPTNTVARRAAVLDPMPTSFEAIHMPSEEVVQVNAPHHGKKRRLLHF
ncbi:hypothetical protein BU15DRAFT_87366 [Melanogaster broomeanus]|nr:hypothetical protein BU15DRAFT_87366 [Melanogaster broomeanus]